jgi:hypothetical protein
MNLSNVQSIDEIRNIIHDYLKYYGITLRPDKNILLDDLDPVYHRGVLLSNKYQIISCNAYWNYKDSKWYYLNNGAASLLVLRDIGEIQLRVAISGLKDEKIAWIVVSTSSSTGLNLPTLSPYANNAAALAGGLVAGDLYRTNGDPDVVCIVH